MFAYSARRILTTIPLLVFALYLVHVGVSATTDPLGSYYQCYPERCKDAYERIVAVYDLDVNIWLRPFTWAEQALSGSLGDSSVYSAPVSEVLVRRGIDTAWLAVPAFLISMVLSLWLSVFSARRAYSKLDYLFTGLSFIGFALPTFVVGLVIQVVFGYKLDDWFGIKPFFTGQKHTESTVAFLGSIVLPVITLVIVSVAGDSRFGRASMLETLNADFVRTARAKGLPERRVVWRHALRNALIPLVTLWALGLSALLSGSLITESIFSWPGLGRALLDGFADPDLDLVMGITIVTAAIAVFFNLLADLLYGMLDPRVRYD